MGDMGGLTNMAPQGATPKIPSPAPMYDAQMDIGKAVQNLGNTISGQIQAETKENEAMEVNRATVEYRTRLDQLYNETIDGKKDDYENWSVNFGEAADKAAAEILGGMKVSPQTRERASIAFAGYDRPYLSRIDGTARRYKEDKVFGDTAGQLDVSMAPALKPDATPEEAEEAFRQTDALLKNAEKFLPQRRVDQLRREFLTGSGPKSILYQYGLREAAREIEKNDGIATGDFFRDLQNARPYASQRYGGQDIRGPSPDVLTRFQDFGAKQQSFDPSAPVPSDEQVAAQNKDLVDKFNAASRGPTPYSGPMPRIDKLPNGVPFTPTQVPREINQSRPNFERGRMLLGVGEDAKPIEVPYFTGSKTQANYPGLQYGAFTLLPHRVGENHRYGDTISINPLGSTRQTPIEDPKVGRNRNGQLIHPAQGNAANIGCISIPDDQWPEVKSAVSEMWKQHGKTNVVLVNAPGQTQIMSRKQYAAMYGGGAAQSEPDAGAEPAKRFLVLPGLGGTYGRDRAAFADIARRYGGTAEYLDGDPQVGGPNSPQIAKALDRLEKGDYDGIIGYSAGAYNLRHILNSERFKALPTEKQDRIKNAIAVGLSEEHVGNFKLDARYNPEVFGNLGASHEDAPRALAKKLGNSPRQAAEGINERISPQEFFRGKGVNVAQLPLGMRISNNPGNLKFSGSAWQRENLFGLVGASSARDQGDPQAQFANPLAGMASAVKLAETKFRAHGLDTVEKIITDEKNGWTPGFKGAADNIAQQMGVRPTDKINLDDPGTMRKFMRALIAQEHGDAGKLYDDDLIRRGVDIGLGKGDGTQPVRVADARMNLGGPKEQDQGPDAAPFDPSSDIEQGLGELPPPQEAPKTVPFEQLSPRARILSHLSPEAINKLENVARRNLTDSGARFEANAVARALQTGEDYRHPVTGQTYAEWAKVRQPQQLAKGVRKIEEAKRRFNAMAEIGYMSPENFSRRLSEVESDNDPNNYAANVKLQQDMLDAWGKAEKIHGTDGALGVSGYSIKRGGVPTFDMDENGRVRVMPQIDGFAKPHPFVAKALEDIRGDGEPSGVQIVKAPDGSLTINTSKALSPMIRQQAWDTLIGARMAAQETRGTPTEFQRALTRHEARTFLGKVPDEPGEFADHWKGVADRIEKMVGPQWAPKVMQDIKDFYIKDQQRGPIAAAGIEDAEKAASRFSAGIGPKAAGVRAGDMERLDRFGRALDGVQQTPGQPLEVGIGGPQPFYEVNPYAGGVPIDPNRPSISPMTSSLQNLTAASRGQADQVNAKPTEAARKWVLEHKDDPAAQRVFTLKYGPGVWANIINESKRKPGWLR